MHPGKWKRETVKQFKEWPEKKNRFFFERRLETILPFVPEGPRLLDAGCGDSEMLERLRENKKLKFSVGIDIHKNLAKGDFPVLRADAENVPFKRDSFDCVIASAVLEHLPQPEKAISEFKDILVSKGILIITTPNPIYSKFAKLAALFKLKYREGPESPLTLLMLKKMLEEKDFSIIHTGGFLVSPIKIPFEIYLEKVFQRRIGGRTLLLNQVVVARKD